MKLKKQIIKKFAEKIKSSTIANNLLMTDYTENQYLFNNY